MNKYIRYTYVSILIGLSCTFQQSYALDTPKSKYLVFGASGWIGGKLMKVIRQQGHVAIAAQSRLQNRQDIEKEIGEIKPDFVINAAGVIGSPNVDWCEDHKQEVIRSNIIGALTLADVCYLNGIHMTNFGTGCLYEYDAEHPMYSGKGFTEDDKPNFDGSFYSKTKAYLDSMLRVYPNVLNLRLRMPISDDLSERSLITKISRYQKVINIPNSMTILTDLLPISMPHTVIPRSAAAAMSIKALRAPVVMSSLRLGSASIVERRNGVRSRIMQTM